METGSKTCIPIELNICPSIYEAKTTINAAGRRIIPLKCFFKYSRKIPVNIKGSRNTDTTEEIKIEDNAELEISINVLLLPEHSPQDAKKYAEPDKITEKTLKRRIAISIFFLFSIQAN